MNIHTFYITLVLSLVLGFFVGIKYDKKIIGFIKHLFTRKEKERNVSFKPVESK